jgi:hypothetical protein
LDIVDQLTRPRVYVPMGLVPTPSGRETLTALPRWPEEASMRIDERRGP